jgi:hypothetical protein
MPMRASRRKRHLSTGGCLFTAGLVALLIYFAIFRLITGHLPEYAEYMVWGYIAISIFGEAYINLDNAIDESTDEIKAEIEEGMKRLEDKIKEEVRKLGSK